ncbi:MAG: putative toxin-antitoxin system toxin component, PIN family [Gemmataceae bacterium]|nr:putative toxin-antitoxin system toxin component, PIN family [Gemmataceae bacterium]
MTPRAVFDCMVLLQAAANDRGPAGRCLALAEAGVVTLCVGDASRAEIDDVVHRPSVRGRFRTLTDPWVATFLANLDRIAVRIDPVPAVCTLARDPKDEKYLNLAVAAGAAYLVSRDNDLLDLMTGTDADAVAFRTAHPGVLILDPAAFLQTITPAPPAAPPPPTP